MSKKRKESRGKLRAALIERIYAAALNPSDYAKIFETWDQHFDTLEPENDAEEAENFDWAGEFVLHFEKAGDFFESLPSDGRLTIEQRVDEVTSGALACRPDGTVIHMNETARDMLGSKTPRKIFDLAFDRASQKLMSCLLHEVSQETSEPSPGKNVLRIFPSEEDEPYFFLADKLVAVGAEKPCLLLRSISVVWREEIEATLKHAFELTDAEVNLVANLYKGYSIREIAEIKGRSQATLRTQLSSVLGKTSTKNQTALLRLVASLAHMTRSAGDVKSSDKARLSLVRETKQRTGLVELSNGLLLEYVESGDLDGAPFYFVQTSTTPNLTPEIVSALEKQNIRLISPVRPGNGRTTRAPITMTAADWGKLHIELIDRLNIDQLACGGHCSGGVYGIELARQLKHRCKGLLLVDFGAPLERLSMFYAMPQSPRRHFLASRYFPRATLTPIKYVAADFHSGPEGEARAVRYFYDGSPADEAIIHLGENWKITRDNLAYCFCNIPQIVRDVSLWMRDNSKTLAQAAKLCSVRFFHGEENLMLKAEWIEDYCARTPNTSARIVSGNAQLLIYMNPEKFAEEISALAHAK